MYIDTIPNRNSPPAILLREGRRQGKRIIKRTLANLSHWPQFKVEALRALLNNQPLVSPRDAFMIERSLPHGHVLAVLGMIHKLGLDVMLSYEKSRDRDLVVAMIAERLIHPCSKLATTRLWHATTLAEELNVTEATEDDLYQAMDWLLARQAHIGKKLAQRHLVVPENPDLNDKVGFAFTPSILARLRILSALRVPFWVVPQPCRPPT